MKDYLSENYYCDEENKGELHISVNKLKDFQKLIDQAEKEACQLKETIDKLKRFEIKIEFSYGDTTI